MPHLLLMAPHQPRGSSSGKVFAYPHVLIFGGSLVVYQRIVQSVMYSRNNCFNIFNTESAKIPLTPLHVPAWKSLA